MVGANGIDWELTFGAFGSLVNSVRRRVAIVLDLDANADLLSEQKNVCQHEHLWFMNYYRNMAKTFYNE